jgi:putative NADPH-quinone reductase
MSDRKNILVINGNPDPAPERLSFALSEAYATGARGASHVVERLDIGSLSFPVLHKAIEFATPAQHPDIADAYSAILRADHLVLVYPLWLGAAPALLKAFLEQISCGEGLIGHGGNRIPQGKLRGRSARIIVTMGMPALAYRLLFGAHGTKALERSVLRLAGLSPIRTSYFGGVGGSPEDARTWLARVHRLGNKAL